MPFATVITLNNHATLRFNELHQLIDNISQKMLTVILKTLEAMVWLHEKCTHKDVFPYLYNFNGIVLSDYHSFNNLQNAVVTVNGVLTNFEYNASGNLVTEGKALMQNGALTPVKKISTLEYSETGQLKKRIYHRNTTIILP